MAPGPALIRWSALLVLMLPGLVRGGDSAAERFFEQKVRPALANHCFACHGPEKQRGGLRLDSPAALRKGGDNGPVLITDKPDESPLLRAISYKHDPKMPPKGKLAEADIAALAAWVKMGAPWPASAVTVPVPPTGFTPEQRNYWAFKSPVANRPPAVKDGSWPANPIDHFILAKLEAKGLRPAVPADRVTLLRRVTFDLTGLPPTPEEVEEARNAKQADWYERVVERLLASPAYGERWGRRWLDVARYADSNGMDENLAHANAWRYRDYIIAGFNRDRPYRDLVREQIAGDLLPTGDAERVIATGFLSIGPKMLAEDDPVKMRMDIVDEQIDAVGQAFLGLTLGCARCHDHKFDPIPTDDYYGMAGIFRSTKTMNTYTVVAQWHERPLATPDAVARLAEADRQIAEKKKAAQTLADEANRQLLAEAKSKTREYAAAAEELRRQPPPRSFLAEANRPLPTGASVREAESFDRGNVKKEFAGYGDKIGVIYNAGPLPNVAEYDVTVPTAGTYQLEIRHAAAESRPIEVHVNGKLVLDRAAGQVTGSWFPDTQRWHVAGLLTLSAGKNVIRLERKQPFPHIDKLALIPLASPPRTPEQLAGERRLNAPFLRQWLAYLERTGKTPEGAELQRVADEPQGPFAVSPQLEAYFPEKTRTQLRQTREELARLDKSRPMLPQAMAVSEDKVENVRVHVRGSHLTLGTEVPRRFPRILAGESQKPLSATQSGRRELAEWITRDDHPLTARVMVNRIWLGHFGEGLVRTPDNFGNLGDRPVHPELLDWLAVRFVREGWSMKALHRLIVTSSTYRMSTAYDESAARVDPDNRLHWRFNRQRLEAEAIRDAVLAVSGRLERRMGGSLLTVANRAYVTSTVNKNYEGYDHACRSVYLPVVRSDVFAMFQAFDFADPSTLTGKRATTTVAPQALFMMNGKLIEEETRHLAGELLKQNLDDAGRLRSVYLRAYSRAPSEAETGKALAFLARYQQALRQRGTAPEEARRGAWQGLCRVLLSSNEFVYVE